MPSLRKRVSSYLRQLSFHNEPRDKHINFIENTFIIKYLQGEIVVKEGPPIHNGKVPTDLPSFELGAYKTGPETVVGCFSGPDGGLTAVKRKEKHLSLGENDIDFIDTQDEQTEVAVITQETPPPKETPPRHLDNSTMVIKMAGQEYFVTNRRKSHSKSHSLGSLKDFDIEVDKTKRLLRTSNNNNNNNNHTCVSDKNTTADSAGGACDKNRSGASAPCDNNLNNLSADDHDDANSNSSHKEASTRGALHRKLTEKQGTHAHSLAKSQSAGNPFRHGTKMREGRIRQLAERPGS